MKRLMLWVKSKWQSFFDLWTIKDWLKSIFSKWSVVDTSSLTLKDEIFRVLAQYVLKVDNMRRQWYDGASNIRGQFNGLQALFLKDCPYAYYVHSFIRRVKLTFNVAAKGVSDAWQLFSILNLIVNYVDSPAKRHFPTFTNMSFISDLCRLMVKSKKSGFYHMIYRLICLILTLSVSTTTTEITSSSMNIIKRKLINKMTNEFIDDLMVLYVEGLLRIAIVIIM